MSQTIKAVGMAWYCRQDYRRVLEIMEDADKLPATYDKWLKNAEAGERELKRRGHIVVRAIINPNEFIAWCWTRNLNIDAQARIQWGNEVALRQVKGSH